MKGGKPENLKNFPKGVSGNPAGRPPKLPELDKLMAKVLGGDENQSGAEAILQALVKRAMKGDTRAAEILLNRGYGLQKQQVHTEGVTTVIVKHES